MPKKINHLVVDTTAFIKAANLQDFAENVYTIQEVIDEITNDRQRRKLAVLPYNLKVKDVFTENIKFVSDFSKKTGDYTSLSATDIKVIALTYQTEKEKMGDEHLKKEPTMQKIVKVLNAPGVDHPKEHPAKENSIEDSNSEVSEEEQVETETTENKNDELDEELVEELKKMIFKDNPDASDIMEKVSNNTKTDESEESDSDDADDDDGDWITPKNVAEKKREMDEGVFEEKEVEVACITSDFAMQNVLKQMGLNVTAIDGRVIRQLRTFIFRCTTCFKTTSVMTKLFCPNCGHATLKKVSVSIDEHGNQHIHINGKKPLTARGKRFSLPTPKGGQHFQYPILTEDQHIHKRFATKMARKKTNPLDDDYTAGFSPFVMKDVNSKSAVLGVRANKHDVKYWMKNYSKGKKK